MHGKKNGRCSYGTEYNTWIKRNKVGNAPLVSLVMGTVIHNNNALLHTFIFYLECHYSASKWTACYLSTPHLKKNNNLYIMQNACWMNVAEPFWCTSTTHWPQHPVAHLTIRSVMLVGSKLIVVPRIGWLGVRCSMLLCIYKQLCIACYLSAPHLKKNNNLYIIQNACWMYVAVQHNTLWLIWLSGM